MYDKTIRVDSKIYKKLSTTLPEVATQNNLMLLYQLQGKPEFIRKLFDDFSPHACNDVVIFMEMKLPQETLLYKDNGMFVMYNEFGLVEGAFIGSGVFRIMNTSVLKSARGKGVGQNLLQKFIDEICLKYRVYCLDLLAQDQYCKKGKEEITTKRLEKFYEKFGFYLEKEMGEMIKPIATEKIDFKLVHKVLEKYYSTRSLKKVDRL